MLACEGLQRHGAVISWQKADILSLLTGWDTGLPSSDLERSPSFGKHFAMQKYSSLSIGLYRRYLFALAQLSCREALAKEWERSEAFLKSAPEKMTEDHVKRQRHFFAFTYALAGHPERALEILRHVPPSESDHKLTQATTRAYRSFVYDHYSCLNLSAGPKLWEKIDRDFQSIPADPKRALELFKRYLVMDYTRGHTLRNVEIHEIEGQEILLVSPLKQTQPLYAKALTAPAVG